MRSRPGISWRFEERLSPGVRVAERGGSGKVALEIVFSVRSPPGGISLTVFVGIGAMLVAL